ncbi:MAG: hypothetical protein ABI999_16195 [Acidobacteriota bacterium]
MSDEQNQQPSPPTIHVNEYGAAKDSTVLIEEADRSVLLTEDQTVIFEKQPTISINPANRPRKVYGGMWGPPEIAVVGVASIAVLGAILLYFLAVVPSNREIERVRTEGDRLQLELTSANSKYGTITSTETQVAKLVSSVNDFEMHYLSPAPSGKNAVYQRINGLISSYDLTNTTGPDYVPLEAPDQDAGKQTEEERGRAKFRSVFPGMYVTMTLEGSYQNLRRFINDIERGNDFVVVSAIELEPSDSETQKTVDTAAQPAGQRPVITNPAFPGNPTMSRPSVQLPRQQTTPPRGKTHGETVSLRLELAAYFRRPSFVAMGPLPEGGTQ